MIKVFGHISPDTDTTASAVIWAWYLNEHTSKDAEAFVLGELNTETSFVLNRFEIEAPTLLESVTANDKVVIVDTNNPKELPEGILETDILTIIDHHKLVGGLETSGPIDVTLRPLACTATVLFDLMSLDIKELPEHIAGLMLSAILSDTLAFRSPTTTPHDKQLAEKLAEALDVSIDEYSAELFAAKSDVSAFSDKGLITLDSKKYDVGDKSIRVSVIETTLPETILARSAGLIEAIEGIKQDEHDTDEVIFFVIDILKEEATVLTHNDLTKEIIAKSFSVEADTEKTVLAGIISRKKQIVPVLTL